MTGAKRVVFRFVATQKTADAPILFDRRQQIATARQNLVRVCLVTNIPDQAIMGRIESVVKRDRELNGTQRRASVPAYARHSLQNILTNFVGDPLKIVDWKLAKI